MQPGSRLHLHENILKSVERDLKIVRTLRLLIKLFANIEFLVAFTAEDIRTFKQDHQSYQKFRKGEPRSKKGGNLI